MDTKDLLEQAIRLKPVERLKLVDGLLKSLDEPDKRVDEIWAEEAERRLEEYRKGNIKGIPMDEIFGEE